MSVRGAPCADFRPIAFDVKRMVLPPRYRCISPAISLEIASRMIDIAGVPPMYIAMNRFRVAKGSEAAFEHVWQSRETHLDKVPGFIEFHLLKGPEAEDHT